MAFIIAAVLLLAVVLALLSLPWWRKRRRAAPRPLSGEQLVAELDDDIETGLLAAEDLKPAARDLEVTADPGREGAGPETPRRFSPSLLYLLLVPLAAGILYVHFGNWRAALLGPRAATRHEASEMLAELRAHMNAHPDDPQGWINLGQGDEAMGRYPAAVRAFGRAVKLQPKPDANTLALWGEAQLLSNPRQLTPEEQHIFARVLKLDPNNARGLWYGGLLALASGDRDQARADWHRLLAQPGVPSNVAAVVRQHLTMLSSSATASGGAGSSGASASAVGGQTAPAGAVATGPRQVKVTVRVAPALASRVKTGETLYVFVRPRAGGPPVAVKRLRVSGFPVSTTLDDRDAMMGGGRLSAASGPLEVVARLAPSGDATPRAGDLEGASPLPTGSAMEQVRVVISRDVAASGSP